MVAPAGDSKDADGEQALRSDADVSARNDAGLDAAGDTQDAGSGPVAALTWKPPRRILADKFLLISPIRPCTNHRLRPGEQPVDRWCAIRRAGELFVINLSKALNQPAKCDGTDPNCLRLTTTFTLLHSSQTHIGLNLSQFWGDLLIFTSDVKPPIGDLPRATYWAWQPGWLAPVKLTSDEGLHCGAARNSPSVWCIDRIRGKTGEYALLAGPVTSSGFAPTRLAQATNEYLSADFSNDGRYLAYQQLADDASVGPMVLVPMATASDRATHVTIHKSVALDQFDFAEDAGRFLYFVHGPQNADPTKLVGTLAFIDIEKPAARMDLAPQVGSFDIVSGVDNDHLGVAALQNEVDGTGVIKLFLGSREHKPVTVGTGSNRFQVSPDTRFTFFQPDVDPATGRRDARVADHQNSGVCALQKLRQTEPVSTVAFTDNGERVIWKDFPDPSGDALFGDGWLGRSADCGDQHKFASGVSYWRVIDNRGLVFVDQFAETGGVLRVLKWGPGMSWPDGGPTVVQERAGYDLDLIAPPLGEDVKYVVYRSYSPGADGLYVLELLP